LDGKKYTEWKKKPDADKTWKNLVTFIKETLADVTAINKVTAGDNKLFEAHSVTDTSKESETIELTNALDNLANAALYKKEYAEALQTSIAEKDKQLVEKDKVIAELVKQNTTLINKLGSNNENSGGNLSTPGAGWADPNGYCWTHGYRVGQGHNSMTCRDAEKPGHKKEATRQNIMGGSTKNAGFGNKPNGK